MLIFDHHHIREQLTRELREKISKILIHFEIYF